MFIDGIPSIIYGGKSDKVYLFVHGQSGHKEEAESFAEIVSKNGWQVLSIDLPEHGERKNETGRFFPWIIVPELQKIWSCMDSRWERIALRATSVGVWFSMLAFQDKRIEKNLFVSPVLDMEHLIENMMQYAGVTTEELKAKKMIPTGFGQTPVVGILSLRETAPDSEMGQRDQGALWKQRQSYRAFYS